MAEEPKSKPPQDIVAEIGVDDLYAFLGIDSTSSEKEITSGYRKKALKYHPDKNRDNPNASDLFQKLSKAYNILTDPAAKAAYDKWLRAKYAAKKRHEDLNSKRRKLKESLEVREGKYQNQSYSSCPDEMLAAKQMQKEINRHHYIVCAQINRLREEGFKKMKEQEEWLRQQLLSARKEDKGEDKGGEQDKGGDEDLAPTLKVTWKAKKGDAFNGGYTAEILQDIFSKFGVHHILVSKKRNGKAIISFHSSVDAQRALNSGCGLEESPLHMAWASGEPKPNAAAAAAAPFAPVPMPGGNCNQESLIREEDYENTTLMRLRQAHERKKIIEELQREIND